MDDDDNLTVVECKFKQIGQCEECDMLFILDRETLHEYCLTCRKKKQEEVLPE